MLEISSANSAQVIALLAMNRQLTVPDVIKIAQSQYY